MLEKVPHKKVLEKNLFFLNEIQYYCHKQPQGKNQKNKFQTLLSL